jgi:DHA1 family tetracycline resistance protein-like MFS transporter
LKPLNDLLGEKLVVALAFTCGAIDNTMYGLAKHKQTIFAAVGVAGLTGMAFPTISAIKANNVAESEQGRIQGALYSLQALASGIGPVALRYVYGKTQHTKVGPGAMFVFAAGLYLIAACIACALPNDKANASRPRHTDDDAGHDDGQDSQLLSESSMSDEEDYGATTARSHSRI